MSEIDDIRRQMAQIRHDLHQDVSSVVGGVSEVVTEVEEAMDWRSVDPEPSVSSSPVRPWRPGI